MGRPPPAFLTLEPELPAARIHVTLNGRAPAPSDPIYAAPIPVSSPALVRAAIVRDDGTLGRAKSCLACGLIDSRRLAVVPAGRIVTLRILDAVGGVSAISRFKPFRR